MSAQAPSKPGRRLEQAEPRFYRDGQRLTPSRIGGPAPAPPTPATPTPVTGAGLLKPLIFLCMAAVFAFMWVGAPLAWLWGVSQLTSTFAPSLGLYALVLFGFAATVAIAARLLHALDVAYCRVTKSSSSGSLRYGHLRPSCEGARAGRRSATPLDVISVGVVVLAFAVLVAWFFLEAGSPFPGY